MKPQNIRDTIEAVSLALDALRDAQDDLVGADEELGRLLATAANSAMAARAGLIYYQQRQRIRRAS